MSAPSMPQRKETARTARPATRRRFQRDVRERHFLDEAVTFFAEVGFSGDTKTLASRLGVAQPLLYRYFASKEALIQRVFEDTFLANWNPLWEEMLTDPALSVPARLLAFHNDFARVHLKRDRVRLSLFFALHGWDMTTYFRLMRERVYLPIAANLRAHAGRRTPSDVPLQELEVELAKTVVEKIQYYGIRKWVYGIPSLPPIEPLIAIAVHGLLDGVSTALPDA
ncbi:TetR/AcrR family transcriptional regulator [Roseomonas sp. BN140053]|uniref:TetR/AcrR family transcriptional regulator n=1 Tax=Roseomonas sp. BN140053 TaxID=3391898 RepID=UPI0039E7B5E4